MIHSSKDAKLPVLCIDSTKKKPDFKEFNKLEKPQRTFQSFILAKNSLFLEKKRAEHRVIRYMPSILNRF
jgi:hypothetical protein